MKNIANLFCEVMECDRCVTPTNTTILRDNFDHIPQPGFIGDHYDKHRILLVGRNPGIPGRVSWERDRQYTGALRAFRDSPSPENYENALKVTRQFIPDWPVHGNYFPLQECGLTLDDIAYCNLVRCRTLNDKAPTAGMTAECTTTHFAKFVDEITPSVVVFIGKWPFDKAHSIVDSLGIPSVFMNRLRSLSSEERLKNRKQVVSLVRSAIGK